MLETSRELEKMRGEYVGSFISHEQVMTKLGEAIEKDFKAVDAKIDKMISIARELKDAMDRLNIFVEQRLEPIEEE